MNSSYSTEMILTLLKKPTEMVILSEVHVYLSYKIAICQSRIGIILLLVVMETSWTGNVISVMPMGTSHLNVHKQMSTETCKLYKSALALRRHMNQGILLLTQRGSF